MSLSAPSLINPLGQAAYKLTSRFANRIDPITKSPHHHNGLDLAAPIGTPVLASAAGKVKTIYQDGVGRGKVNGNAVALEHGQGRVSWYLHLSRVQVREGQDVAAGQEIGAVGSTGASTGPHLHFAVTDNGVFVDPHPLVSWATQVPMILKSELAQRGPGFWIGVMALTGGTILFALGFWRWRTK